MVITPLHPHERPALLALAIGTGLFSADEAEALLGGVIDALDAQALPDGHVAVACRASEAADAIGWAYYAPDAYADGVVNLWWIGVDPGHHGTGAGPALLAHVERAAADRGARVIVIETSDQAPLARARGFYRRQGYAERGRIPDFYGAGDAKVIFSRTLTTSA